MRKVTPTARAVKACCGFLGYADLAQMELVKLPAERRAAAELSRPLATLDSLSKSHVLLANSDYDSPKLGYEYEYFIGKPVVQFQTDSSGFVSVRQGYWEHRDILGQCHLALQHFQLYLSTGFAPYIQLFLEAGDMLLSNLESVSLDGRRALLGYNYIRKKEYPGHRVPWLSALSQGAIVRVMCRMWQAARLEKYVAAALAAIEPFLVPVERGGVLTELGTHGKWYEEYPFAECRHVLNGFISALFSLHELSRVARDNKVRQLWSAGIDTLISPGLLDRFDTGYWTRYDLTPGIIGVSPASMHYHNVHVLQMSVLARITGEKCFSEAAERWALYARTTGTRLRSQILVLVYRATQSRRYARELVRTLLN